MGCSPCPGLVGASALGCATGVRHGLGAQERLWRESELLFPAVCVPRERGQVTALRARGLGRWTRLCVSAWLCHLLDFSELLFAHLHRRIFKSAMYVKHLVIMDERAVITVLAVSVIGVLWSSTRATELGWQHQEEWP